MGYPTTKCPQSPQSGTPWGRRVLRRGPSVGVAARYGRETLSEGSGGVLAGGTRWWVACSYA